MRAFDNVGDCSSDQVSFPSIHAVNKSGSEKLTATRLSRILARILRALYGIQPPSTEEHFTLASKFTQDLAEWREHISYLLDAGGSSAIFVKLVLRQRDVLKLAFWHAQILVHRPFLLKSFTALAGDGTGNEAMSRRKQEMEDNIRTCVRAATSIAEHIDQIDAVGEFYSTLFVGPDYWRLFMRARADSRLVHPILRVQRRCHHVCVCDPAKGGGTGDVPKRLPARLEVPRSY